MAEKLCTCWTFFLADDMPTKGCPWHDDGRGLTYAELVSHGLPADLTDEELATHGLVRDETLEAWVRTVPALALREMADGMPGRHESSKQTITAWMLEHRRDVLEESYLLSHPIRETS